MDQVEQNGRSLLEQLHKDHTQAQRQYRRCQKHGAVQAAVQASLEEYIKLKECLETEEMIFDFVMSMR